MKRSVKIILIIFIILLVVGGGVACYYFKPWENFTKPGQDTQTSVPDPIVTIDMSGYKTQPLTQYVEGDHLNAEELIVQPEGHDEYILYYSFSKDEFSYTENEDYILTEVGEYPIHLYAEYSNGGAIECDIHVNVIAAEVNNLTEYQKVWVEAGNTNVLDINEDTHLLVNKAVYEDTTRLIMLFNEDESIKFTDYFSPCEDLNLLNAYLDAKLAQGEKKIKDTDLEAYKNTIRDIYSSKLFPIEETKPTQYYVISKETDAIPVDRTVWSVTDGTVKYQIASAYSFTVEGHKINILNMSLGIPNEFTYDPILLTTNLMSVRNEENDNALWKMMYDSFKTSHLYDEEEYFEKGIKEIIDNIVIMPTVKEPEVVEEPTEEPGEETKPTVENVEPKVLTFAETYPSLFKWPESDVTYRRWVYVISENTSYQGTILKYGIPEQSAASNPTPNTGTGNGSQSNTTEYAFRSPSGNIYKVLLGDNKDFAFDLTQSDSYITILKKGTETFKITCVDKTVLDDYLAKSYMNNVGMNYAIKSATNYTGNIGRNYLYNITYIKSGVQNTQGYLLNITCGADNICITSDSPTSADNFTTIANMITQ